MARILSIAVAILLITSASLKVYGLLFTHFEPHLLLPYRWQHLALFVLEFLLGIWLLSGKSVALARRFGILFFSLAALASLFMGWTGQTSCGCFGSINTSPWVALGIDLAAIVALLMIRCSRSEPIQPLKSTAFQVVLGSIVFLGLGIEIFFLTVPNPERVLAKWRGDFIVPYPTVLDAGSATFGEKRALTLRIDNNSDRNVAVLGGTSSCACVVIESLPVSILIGGSQYIQIIVSFKGSPGKFIRQFVLYTDHPSARVLYGSFRGEVIETLNKPE